MIKLIGHQAFEYIRDETVFTWCSASHR